MTQCTMICLFIYFAEHCDHKEEVPLNRPRCCNDFALRRIASISKLTACIDIGGVAKLCERLLWCSRLLARVAFILGVTAAIFIPSNT